ncbi:paraquat-inducible protein A [Reichenbachiella agarivorans]|uniref:Paraquat-inducible protein A n=1 Tax=Reichenbachiella agarivorans TaxID=2979464 RepID=A0ABY6CLL8_9BACT|nr:paraquat-inducible protein A [Reichenbachiella agarivorans]UXP31279.1 paraquat-inducible protein A [Reichenbachiella agarivorans]
MLKRNIVALVLTIISLAILYPGLTFPILQITVSADLPILGKTTFYEQTQSILQTVETLYKTNNKFVASLIFLFSVVVPATKGVIVLSVLLIKDFKLKYKLYKFVHSIGKWSMADVFAVAVFMAFLSAQSNSSVEAVLHQGFFYFASYCLISLLGLQFIKIAEPA